MAAREAVGRRAAVRAATITERQPPARLPAHRTARLPAHRAARPPRVTSARRRRGSPAPLIVGALLLLLVGFVRARSSTPAAAAAKAPPASPPAATAVSTPLPAAAPSPAIQRQAQAILDQSGGTAAMVLAQPGKAPLVAINASQVMPSASLYKLGVMAAVYQAAANGRVSFDQQLTITQDEVDTYGDAPATDPGTTLPVSELLRRMITVSDNSAAGALIDLVGAQAVNAAFAANGMPSSHLGDGDSVAETTAADQVAFYQRLLDGKVVDKNASNAMLNLLEAQQENDRLPAELPPGTVVAHKTGELEDVRNDSGIIFTPAGPVICAVLISDQPQASLSIGAIAGEGHLAYRALIPAASGSRP